MSRPWDTIRVAAIRCQGGRCATPDCHRGEPLDVVPVPARPDCFHAYCRSCRLKLNGSYRARKAAATRLRRRNVQTRFVFTS